MTWEIAFVFVVAVVALILFVTERYPIDQVAVAIPIVLLVAGIITPEEAVSGLSHTGTVTVAAMLVLSLGLVKTGAIATIARWARTAPLGSPRSRLMVLCLIVAAISPFLNNTAVVAVFLPVFLSVAQSTGEPASRFLIPLSYVAILGGTVTLIGTSTNLIVYGMAKARGYDELSLFSLAPLGLIYLAIGFVYLFSGGRWLLPHRTDNVDLSSKYEVRNFVTEWEVRKDSPVVGKTLADLGWEERYDVSILGVERDGQLTWGWHSARPLQPGDMLIAEGETGQLLLVAEKQQLDSPAERRSDELKLDAEEARLVELLIGPDSSLVGHTLQQLRFQWRYDATVMAVQRHGVTLWERLGKIRLRVGDLLLVHGPATPLKALADEPGFIPLGEVKAPVTSRPKALVAVGILVGVVAAAGFGLLPILPAALTGVAVLLFTRCIHLDEIYAELDWMVVFLLAGLIPLGIAMDQSGAAEWLGRGVAQVVGPLGPVAVIGGLYLVTSLLTEIMANVAAAVVLTPIALLTAAELGMNPYALIVAVMFGASASFMTPMGYQTNTLIYGPGGYRFTDYLKVGIPLNLILLATAALLIPLLWPS